MEEDTILDVFHILKVVTTSPSFQHICFVSTH